MGGGVVSPPPSPTAGDISYCVPSGRWRGIVVVPPLIKYLPLWAWEREREREYVGVVEGGGCFGRCYNDGCLWDTVYKHRFSALIHYLRKEKQTKQNTYLVRMVASWGNNIVGLWNQSILRYHCVFMLKMDVIQPPIDTLLVLRRLEFLNVLIYYGQLWGWGGGGEAERSQDK